MNYDMNYDIIQGYKSCASQWKSIKGKFTEEVSLKEVLKKKQSSLEIRNIGLFAEEAYMKSFH